MRLRVAPGAVPVLVSAMFVAGCSTTAPTTSVTPAPAPAVQVAIPPQPSIRRDALQPAATPQRPGIQPAPQGFGQHTPTPQLRRSSDSVQASAAALPAPAVGQQASLANLIKQFRT